MKRFIVCVIAITLLSLGYAEEKNTNWNGEVELGLNATTGNTETTNINAKFKLQKETDPWRQEYRLEALGSSDNDQQTAERYFGSAQVDYKFSETFYSFGHATYEDDRFSGFAYQAVISAGFGKQLWKTNNMELSGEIGLGYRFSELNDNTDENEAIARLAGKYLWQISEQANFLQELSMEGGQERIITKSLSEISANIIGNLALKASLTIKHTSDVPVDIEDLDTTTAVTLAYKF